MDTSDFDSYARDYDRLLNEALAVSGEHRTFFAVGRISWLARRLAQLPLAPETVMDYGCGTGDSTAHLLDLLQYNLQSVRSYLLREDFQRFLGVCEVVLGRAIPRSVVHANHAEQDRADEEGCSQSSQTS